MELNKIYNMDCIEGVKIIPDNTVDLVLTDPPYNIDLKPQRKLTKSIKNDNFEKDIEFVAWFVPLVIQLNRVLKEDRFLIFFTGWSTIPLFRKILDQYFTLKSMPIWVKNNFGIGYYTRPQYEPCLLYMKGNPKPLDKPISDVWHFKKIMIPEHSCQKPIPLMRFIINNFSREKDTVLDPFVGLGSSMMASKQINRKFIGFELEEEYCNRVNEILSQRTIFEINEQKKLKEVLI